MSPGLKTMRMVISALALAASSAAPVLADVNFQGKTITVYVAGGAGGGVDAFARTLVPYLAKYLPGEPAVVVSDMPGAGGIRAVQYVYNIAPKDGTAIGTTNSGPIAEPLFGTVKVNYDMRKFRWVGSLTKGNTVCMTWSTAGITSLKDAKAREVTMSAAGPGSAQTRSALLMNALLGTKFRPISGYDGSTSLLALERREVDGTCLTISTLRITRPEWLREKKVKFLAQMSQTMELDYPNLPRTADLLHTDDERAMLEFFQIPYEFQDPYMLPPGTPDDVLAAYRKAFDAAVRDPAYRSDAEKRSQDVQPRDGAEVMALVQRLFATPKGVLERAIEATKPR
jgi:tripartite-type tricarboxylate transporter receptor subunit TctC